MAGYRRLRPQCPGAAHRHAAGAALRRLRRAEPDLGDAGGAGQAQRPAARRRMARRRSAMRQRGVPAAILDYRPRHDLWLWHATPRRGAGRGARRRHRLQCPRHRRRPARRAVRRSPQLRAVPFLAELLDEIDAALARASTQPRVIHELVRRVITRFVEDVIRESEPRHRRAATPPCRRRPRARATAGRLLPADGGGGRGRSSASSSRNMYRHASVWRSRTSRPTVSCATCSPRFSRRARADAGGMAARTSPTPREAAPGAPRCDYIAGMTDRYALDEHRRLFDATPELR